MTQRIAESRSRRYPGGTGDIRYGYDLLGRRTRAAYDDGSQAIVAGPPPGSAEQAYRSPLEQ